MSTVAILCLALGTTFEECFGGTGTGAKQTNKPKDDEEIKTKWLRTKLKKKLGRNWALRRKDWMRSWEIIKRVIYRQKPEPIF